LFFRLGSSGKPQTETKKPANQNIKASPKVHEGFGKGPKHKGSQKQQEYIDYAWEISHDMNFLYMLKTENGQISPDRRSMIKGKNGQYDYGFCQVNKGHNSGIVNDKRFFADWKWQMDQCWELFRGGTTFYGWKRFQNDAKFRASIKNSFTS